MYWCTVLVLLCSCRQWRDSTWLFTSIILKLRGSAGGQARISTELCLTNCDKMVGRGRGDHFYQTPAVRLGNTTASLQLSGEAVLLLSYQNLVLTF